MPIIAKLLALAGVLELCLCAAVDISLVRKSPLELTNTQPARDYNCDLHKLCGGVGMRAHCDFAVNFMVYRTDNFVYYPNQVFTYGQTTFTPVCAPCWGNFSGVGCGVFIEGPETCRRTGNQVWWDYQAVKKFGCRSCGSVTWGDNNECTTKFNYMGLMIKEVELMGVCWNTANPWTYGCEKGFPWRVVTGCQWDWPCPKHTPMDYTGGPDTDPGHNGY